MVLSKQSSESKNTYRRFFYIKNGFLAQLVEHSTVNRRVVGSSPTVSARFNETGTH